MTMAEEDAAIGSLTRAYHDNERKIVALYAQIDESARALRKTGIILEGTLEHVRLGEDHVFWQFARFEESVPRAQLDLVKIGQWLDELHARLEAKADHEQKLRHARLDGLIQPPIVRKDTAVEARMVDRD